MLITHALQGQKTQKGQTPKRKINRILTAKNQLLQPSTKNLTKPNIENKQNQNPNIRKSPSPTQEKATLHPSSFYPNQQRQTRIQSQYYTNGVPTNVKQSPIKKILFVKNLSYKSAKTSKNSSLDNKKQENLHQNKYVSLGGLHRDENGKIKDERRSYSHYNSNKNFVENESEIFVENKLSQKPIQDFRPKDMITPNNESQASYRMSPNELHTKMAKFNENYISQSSSQQLSKFIPQKLPTYEYPSSFTTENFHNKIIKMCPNIESPDLSSLQSFKNNKYLFQVKRQTLGNTKALISFDKEKKESLSSKKRTSRIKINTKNSQKHRNSFNEQNLTEESDFIVSSPSQPLFEDNHSKASIGEPHTNTGSNNGTKSTNSKERQEQSTLVQTKKFDDTFENLNSEISKASLNESIHCQIQHIPHDNPIQRHSVKHYCLNHPEKQAKFKINKEVQRSYYCSKCTVLLVTQGYKVEQNLEYKNQRLQKLKSFIFQLQILEPKLKASSSNITQLQSQVTTLQYKAQKEIETYYATLIQSLETHKQTTIKSLNYHTSKVMSQLDLMKKKLRENEQQINFLKGDILPNVELIIDEVKIPSQSWKKIIMEHQEKMDEIQRITEMIGKVMNGQGDNRMVLKSVEIPSHEIKSALNLLQRTQIVFAEKILKLQFLQKRQQTSPTNMNETKRSFSFDDENIDTSFYVPSSKKKKINDQLSPEGVENIYELADSIRMSFGNRLDNSGRGIIQSPTFKAI